MNLRKLGALVLLPAAILVFHPLGCAGFYSCEDDATCVGERPDEPEQPMPGDEHCWNGKDDDDDSVADCADPDCDQKSTCLPAIPKDWTGYHWIRVVNDPNHDTKAEKCANGTMPTTYYVDPPEGEHECPVCVRDLVNESSICQLPELECWEGNACDTEIALVTNVNDDGKCAVSKGTGALPAWCRVTGTSTPPVCTTIEGEPIALPTWREQLDDCHVPAAKGAGCSSGACEPLGMSDQRMCIRALGHNRECPMGWTSKREGYASIDDSRKCTPCTCEALCDWRGYIISSTNECGGTELTIKDDTCTEISTQSKELYYGVSFRKPEISYTTGGKAEGELVTTGPVTFCCIEGAD